MIKWLVGRYMKSILNGLLKGLASKTNLFDLTLKIGGYIGKLESLIGFLKSLLTKVSDSELDDGEIDELKNEGRCLIQRVLGEKGNEQESEKETE